MTVADRWKDFRVKARKARDERDDARFALRAAEAVQRLADADWDSAVTSLSSHAFLLANKKADASPYVDLFGGVRANDAVGLGAGKATAFGTRLLEKAKTLNVGELKERVAAVETAQRALADAAEKRELAFSTSTSHDVVRRKLLNELEALADETEVAILTAKPGRRDLVSAVLTSAFRKRRESSSSDSTAEPVDTGEG